MATRDALTAARDVYASTPSGRVEIERRLHVLSPVAPEAVDLQASLRRGSLLRERNRAVGLVTPLVAEDAQTPWTGWDVAADLGPHTDPVDLERMFIHGNDEVKARCLYHPRATVGMLNTAIIEHSGLQQIVAEHENATEPMLAYLSKHPKSEVRDAARESLRERGLPIPVCEATRYHEGDSPTPCVLEPDHGGSHEDAEGYTDDFLD